MSSNGLLNRNLGCLSPGAIWAPGDGPWSIRRVPVGGVPGRWARAACPLPMGIIPERSHLWQPPGLEATRGASWAKMPHARSHAARGQSRWQIRGPMRRKAHLRPDFVFVFVVALTEVAGPW